MKPQLRVRLTKAMMSREGSRAGAPQSEAKHRRENLTRLSVQKVIDRDTVVEHLLGLLDDIQDGIERLNDLAVSVPSEAPEAVWHELDDKPVDEPSEDPSTGSQIRNRGNSVRHR